MHGDDGSVRRVFGEFCGRQMNGRTWCICEELLCPYFWVVSKARGAGLFFMKAWMRKCLCLEIEPGWQCFSVGVFSLARNQK